MRFFQNTVVLLVLFLPASLFAWKMESGTVSLPATTVGSSTWQTVTLQQTYDTVPLIFAMPDEGSGYDGDSPAALRIRNIGTGSFEIVQVEPQSSAGDTEGEHAAMTIHYIAVEQGDHTLPDGTRIVAGTHDTTTKQGKNVPNPKGWDNITISPAFSSAPVMLSMIQSLANENSTLPGASSSPWMTAHMRNVEAGSFDIALDRAETSDGSITDSETIGYLAVDSAVSGTIVDTSCQSVSYQTINTGDNVEGWNNNCHSQSFGVTYAGSPNVIGSMQSRDGGDGGWLRRCSLSSSAVGITVDEDQASDLERGHTDETAGLVVFSQNFAYDSALDTLQCGLDVNFQMDECYWLGGANGVTGDAKDSSGNGLHGTSRNKADNTESNAKICRAGIFVNTYPDATQSDAVYYPNETAAELAIGKNAPFSVSAWVYRGSDNKWMAGVIRVSDEGWGDGWGLIHTDGSRKKIDFFVGDYKTYARASLQYNTWTHVVGTYDGATIRIYTDGVLRDTEAQDSYTPASHAIMIGDDVSGSSIDDRWQGNLDEVKIWSRVLSDEEVKTIYDNESAGKNYNGTSRSCQQCNSAPIAEKSWELIGIPADSRTSALTVGDVFSDDMVGTFNTDWRIYKRKYSKTENSSVNEQLTSLDDEIEFGQGYWLGSRLAERWDVDGTDPVSYNSSNPDCPADYCVEIELKSAMKNFGEPDNDPDDGSGPYLYNMKGFIGMDKPVNWADCRFVFDDNGTSYTPSDANASGLAGKQIWLYNPDESGASSNGYITCADDSPGGCKLVPFKGFWVQLHGKTKNKTVKLLIPQE